MQPETLALLDADRRGLLASVERLSEADRERRPAEGRWSAAEILEHLASVEQSVAKLIAIRGREPVPPNQAPPEPMAAERLARMRVRERRIDVPDALRPKGTMTAAAAIEALTVSRAALLDAARAADPVALEQRTYMHREIGRLTLRDWLAFVAHHEARHAAQIDEIAAAFRHAEPA
jgi:uncharacterized damage-inducible protein DinB